MEMTKSKLVKSYSSNSTLTKHNPMDKKSRSNATFQTHLAKKRGVYVERKPSKESLNITAGNKTPKEPVKAPKRPSRGQKRFLSSLLSLLSKSSAGTQFPDSKENKSRMKKANRSEDKAGHKALATIEPEKRKKKYKSKVLNSSNYPLDTFEVLQAKKKIVQTPSVDFSDGNEFEDIKWSEFLPRLVQPNSEELEMEKNKKLSHIVKEVTEGRIAKEKRVSIEVGEPRTLVSENLRREKNTTKDPGFYNFFVDLLETTFSVYNVKSEYDCRGVIPSAMSSKIAFEIDEAVADKLHVAPKTDRQPSTHSIPKEQRRKELADYFQLCAPSRAKSPPPKRNNNKSDYFPKYRTPKPESRQPLLFPQSKSTRVPPQIAQTTSMTTKKSFYKKNSKQMLLNMLKEQLRMDNQPLEEPRNLFQALKVLAKNKRKTQKTLRFQKTPDELAECTFKSRRLVPRISNKLKADSHKILPSPSPSDFKKRQKKHALLEDESSNHSLEVVNIDYDTYRRSRKRGMNVSYNSQRSYSPSFSPAESILDSYYERSYAPMLQQVIVSVKSVNHCRNTGFYEKDEA